MTTKSTSSHQSAQRAFSSSQWKRVNRDGKIVGKMFYNASFARAQRKLKESMRIQKIVSGDAYVAIGSCMDDAASALITRWMAMKPADRNTGTLLTGHLAISGVMSLLEDEGVHDEVMDMVDDVLNTYYDLPAN